MNKNKSFEELIEVFIEVKHFWDLTNSEFAYLVE